MSVARHLIAPGDVRFVIPAEAAMVPRMGFAKDEMMKWQSLNCSPVGDKNICPDCVGDDALKEFIRENALHEECDYCGRTFPEAACAEADTLIEHIARSIGYEYEDPVHSVGYCSAEGGYQLPTMDGADLSWQFDLGGFAEDAANALGGLWVEKDPYGDRPWEYMLSSWSAFAEHVKTRQRFFFPRTPAEESETPDASIFSTIAAMATDSGLITTLPAGTPLFRSRQHAADAAPATAREMGTPPPDKAVFSNRMSPAGIPMFYAAKDADTARAETEASHPAMTAMTTARFVATTDLRILDLADIPPVPSLFDEHRRHLRAGLRFIRSFAEELALPIQRNGQEHIDYVPTQMVSEYFRTIFKLPDGAGLDGLAYRSAKREDGICVCLFLTHADFTGTGLSAAKVPALQGVSNFSLSTPLPTVTNNPTKMGETHALL